VFTLLLQRLQARITTVVAWFFAVYSILIISHSMLSWHQMKQDSDRYFFQEVRQRSELLSNLIDDFHQENRQHALLYEVKAYLKNRDLGMSMRYGLGSSLLAVEQRLKQHVNDWLGAISVDQLLYVDDEGDVLVNTEPATPLPDALGRWLKQGGNGLYVDGEGRLVSLQAVDYPNNAGAMVSIANLRVLLSTGDGVNKMPWREILVVGDGRYIGMRGEEPLLPGMQQAMESIKMGEVVENDAVVANWMDLDKVIMIGLPLAVDGLRLVRIMPRELIYGHIPEFHVMVVAAALPILMLFGAHLLDKTRLAAEQLKTGIALAEQRRKSAEKQNLALSSEIQQRVRVERALKTSEERWMLAVSGANDGIWDWNPETGQTFFSDRWKRLLGFYPGDIADHISERDMLIHPEDQERVSLALDQHLQGATHYYQCEFRMRCKDGHYAWVYERGRALHDRDGKVIRVTGSLSDISDRRQAEFELEQRNAQLNAMFDTSPDGMVSFDPQMAIQFVNPAFLSMTSLDMSSMLGLDAVAFSNLLNGLCDPSAGFIGVDTMRQQPLDSPSSNVIELTSAGKRVLEIKLIESASASIPVILFFRDITAETEVDRMKSEFVSMAAHELRTPMASIYGYSELLLHSGLKDPLQEESAKTIYKEAGLMASIIDEFLDLTRIESRKGANFVFERVDLQQVVEAAVDSYPVPEGRAAPDLEPCAGPLWVYADANKIKQTLNNIVSNAYKYSPQGGAVRVALLSADGCCGFEVRDHGIGMTPEQLERVYERFYRADSAGTIPGTGLGMSIVKEIVDFHGGNIRFSSEYGKGSKVELWLPEMAADGAGAKSETSVPQLRQCLH
jgi:PAS domain S-box-containing protein